MSQFFSNKNNVQIICSFLFFLFVFVSSNVLLRKLSEWFKIEFWRSKLARRHSSIRIVSSLHAVSVTILSILLLIFDPNLNKQKIFYGSFNISLTLNIVIGYMICDLLVMFTNRDILDKQSVVHHLVSLSAFYASSNCGLFAYLALIRLTSEASTLFINLRWFLLSFDMKFSRYYFYNGVTIILLFAIVRVLPILPFWYLFKSLTLTEEWRDVKLWQKLLCVGSSVPLDALNIYWYFLILKNSYKLFRTKDSKNVEQKEN